MTTSKNLWPNEIGRATTKVPKTILVEQANYFNEMTKNRLVAKVHSKHILNNKGENVIVHDFDIVSPSLGNYTFTLFSVKHTVEVYPVYVASNLDEFTFADIQEDKFEETLSAIMNSKKTVDAINGLLAQA